MNKIFIIVGYCLLFWINLIGQNHTLREGEQLIKVADQLLESASYEKALKNASAALLLFEKAPENFRKQIVNCYHLIGNIYLDKSDIAKAKNAFNEALTISLEYLGAEDTLTAQSHNDLGNFYFKSNDFAEALGQHQRALKIRLNTLGADHLETADSYNNMANCFQVAGRYEEALASYQKALSIRKENLGEDHLEVASVYNNMGGIFLGIGDHFKAANYFRRCIKIRLKQIGEIHPKTASAFQNLGNVYIALEQADSAIFYLQKSLDIFNQFGKDHQIEIAQLDNNLGNAYLQKGDYTQSLTYHTQALQIRKKLWGEDHYSCAESYLNLGDTYLEQGDYNRALTYLRQALWGFQSQFGTDHPDLAIIQDKIGLTLSYLSDFAPALEAHKEAFRIREMTFGTIHPFMAGTLINIGNVYWKEKKYAKALSFYEQTLFVLKQLGTPQSLDLARIYSNIGNCFLEMGSPQKALEYFEEAEQSIPYAATAMRGAIIKNKAIALERMEQWDKALQAYELSLTLLEYHPNRNSTFLTASKEILFSLSAQAAGLRRYAIYRNNLEDLLKADQVYKQALQLLDSIKIGFQDVEARLKLAELHYPLYDGSVDLKFRLWEKSGTQTYLEEAFYLSEKSKSLRLLENLRTARNLSSLRLPDSLIKQLKFAEEKIAQLERLRFELERDAIKGPLQIPLIDSNLFALQQKRVGYLYQIDSLSFNNSTNHPEITIEWLQNQLLTPNQGLLAYFMGKEDLFVFYLTHDDFKAIRINKAFPLEDWIADFGRNIIAFPYAAGQAAKKNDETYRQLALHLFQQIWQPMAAEMDLKKELIIIPDGALGYLPFEALLTEQPPQAQRYRSYPFLLYQHHISYAYSATILGESWHRGGLSFSKNCLAIAPSFANHSKKLDPLPFNAEEIAKILKQIGGKGLYGEEGNLSNFLAIAPQYRILHLATHGKASGEYGEFSFLAFAEKEDGLDNEYLYVQDLYNLQLNAEMVVLSACETGVGEYQVGEGFISLARGFANTGAKSIITTLWSVNDAKTAIFMQAFYTYLQQGASKNKALHQAKLDYIQNHPHDEVHPFYWAAFVPFGDMESIDLRGNSFSYFWLVIALLVLLIGFWGWRKF